MLTLVRSTWPNQYYYKTLGKCYIGVLLIHSTALTRHDCMRKIWWLVSLLTSWDSLLLLWTICHNWITWPRVIPGSPSCLRDLIYLQVHQTPICYQISISLLEIQKFCAVLQKLLLQLKTSFPWNIMPEKWPQYLLLNRFGFKKHSIYNSIHL